MNCKKCGSPIRMIGKSKNKEFVGIQQCVNRNCPENNPKKIIISDREAKRCGR